MRAGKPPLRPPQRFIRRNRFARVLQPAVRPAKAGPGNLEPFMVGIGIIVVFLIVIGALNFYEFGRLD
ncbi:hypothetical protein [Phenylobacterium sp.]|uniref:hypothetical protein n=1 Tax=Phenylobacterium sp. TaxID=1871053 RepID=UPI002F410B5E